MDQRLAELSPFIVSLAIGALVGIERERSQNEAPGSFPGGVRTFPLVALLGCIAAWLGAHVGIAGFLVLAAGFLALVVASYVVASTKGANEATTALASLLTFVFGVMAFHDRALLAAALAVATAGLLSLRRPLHQLTSKIEEVDLYAALKLAAITVIVLPLLPDRSFGPPPLDALNPFRIWLLVVLVAGVGFLGYVGVKVLGPGRGIIAAGLLGGLVSSTAATYSLATRSRESPGLARELALGIALAWAAMCLRVILIVAFLNASLLPLAAPGLVAAMAGGIGGAAIARLGTRGEGGSPLVNYKNPFSILAAIRFGAIFTAVILVVKRAQDSFNEAGFLATAAASGAVDVDAMILVLSKPSAGSELSPRLAVAGLGLAVASNTLVKGCIPFVVGTRELRRALAPVVLGTLGAGAIAFWLSLRS